MSLAAASIANLYKLVDWFIPADMAADRDLRKQARMFLISHIFGPFIGNVVPLALYFFDPKPSYDIFVLAISITAFWVYPFLLRFFGRYNLLALISIENLNFCILWSCYFYGGVTSPTLPWILTIPLLAFFYIDSTPSLRGVVLGMFAANLVAFWMVYEFYPPVPPDMPFSSLQALGLVSTIAASLYVTMMALFYAKALASQVELEQEVRQHLATAAELRRATLQAERAGAAKADFLAKMSHELRTPLNAVIGYSQILLEDAALEGDDESASDLDKIHRAGQHLLKLVNDVLDLSKIEAGKMELYVEEGDIGALIGEVVEIYRPLAEAGSVTMSLHVEGTLGPAMFDVSKTHQALCQVLDNAVKFTAKGEIVVDAARISDDGADEMVIKVKDTGIGISGEQIPILFEQFSEAADATTSKYGGTGLGLALGQKLCRLMGGEIRVESRLGAGSCFTLHIPVVAVDGMAANAGQTALADDDGSREQLSDPREIAKVAINA